MLGWLVDGYGNIEEVEVPLCGGFYLPDDRLICQISLIDKFTQKGGCYCVPFQWADGQCYTTCRHCLHCLLQQ